MEILNNLTSNLSEYIIYIGIAVVTIIGFFKCIYPVFRNSTLLNRAIAKLERSTAAGERPIWREARFLGRSLRNEWQEFLLNAGQLDLRGIPCDTSEYINEETVIDKPGHAQLGELIPGLLTSLGILGTFMGLMQGLTSIDFATAEGTMQSIPLLLSGMRFAFATSVAGIACSLVFNMLNRMVIGRATRAMDNFEDTFYELAMPRPLQPDVQMLCQKQDEEARMLRVAESISNHISASLEMAVARAMTPLTQSLDNFIKGATQEQVEGIRRISGQFIQQMNTSLHGQLNTLGDTMNAVTSGQLQTQENLQSTIDTARALSNDAALIQQASSTIANQMQELASDMKATRDAQIASMQTAESSGVNLSNQLVDLAASLSRMQKAVDLLTSELDEESSIDEERISTSLPM